MDIAAIKPYLAGIEQALKAGNATEHTHRPALKSLLEHIAPGVTATNEPKRIQCGAPDYIVTRGDIPLGYLEAKDIGVPLDDVESGEQLRRYRESLANLILTDYLEFRWYVGSEHRLTVRLAKPDKAGKLKLDASAAEAFIQLMDGFFHVAIPVIASPRELAIRMAALARLIRSVIGQTFAGEGEQGALHAQMDAFQKVLLHDMTVEQFGDMYAQTICYGLFAARCNQFSSPTQEPDLLLLPPTGDKAAGQPVCTAKPPAGCRTGIGRHERWDGGDPNKAVAFSDRPHLSSPVGGSTRNEASLLNRTVSGGRSAEARVSLGSLPEGQGRIWINATQYFAGVPPEVWNFHVGGYQVAQKWLKDRKGRPLSYDDLTHYQQVLAALAETIRLQARIDEAIGKWPVR